MTGRAHVAFTTCAMVAGARLSIALVLVYLWIGPGCLFQRTCGSLNDEAIGPPRVHIAVLDAATGSPIDGVTFTESGRSIPASCVVRADGSARCEWELLLVGPHTLVISATGHVAQTVTFDAGSLSAGAESCAVIAAHPIDLTASLASR